MYIRIIKIVAKMMESFETSKSDFRSQNSMLKSIGPKLHWYFLKYAALKLPAAKCKLISAYAK